ncbi:hypothetical protein IWX49DRAFT_206502 [Phyllosticta citricarpa]|uniref:Uncharacterized protein n=1 Tax=Phyllosticta citricarpa TaxID=55181 RepID=A0ABR1MHU5_9PEZI
MFDGPSCFLRHSGVRCVAVRCRRGAAVAKMVRCSLRLFRFFTMMSQCFPLLLVYLTISRLYFTWCLPTRPARPQQRHVMEGHPGIKNTLPLWADGRPLPPSLDRPAGWLQSSPSHHRSLGTKTTSYSHNFSSSQTGRRALCMYAHVCVCMCVCVCPQPPSLIVSS